RGDGGGGELVECPERRRDAAGGGPEMSRGGGLRFNTKFSDLRLDGEAGGSAGAGVHSGPFGVAPLIDSALTRASERCRTAGFNVMILHRHDSIAVLGFGYEPAAIRR